MRVCVHMYMLVIVCNCPNCHLGDKTKLLNPGILELVPINGDFTQSRLLTVSLGHAGWAL